MAHHEHHFRNLERAMAGLVEAIISLKSAAERMSHDDWIDAAALTTRLEQDVRPELSRLRNAASLRFDDWSRHPDFDRMRSGEILFPDERAAEPPVSVSRPVVVADDPPALNGPNAKVGHALVAKHGSVDAAMLAVAAGSEDMDHINAYVYVSTGKRPVGWVPPIVGVDDDQQEAA